MQYCNLQCKIGILGQCWHRFWTLFDPFGWLVAFFPTRMHVRRPLEAKKAIQKFDPKIAYPPPTRPLCSEPFLSVCNFPFHSAFLSSAYEVKNHGIFFGGGSNLVYVIYNHNLRSNSDLQIFRCASISRLYPCE